MRQSGSSYIITNKNNTTLYTGSAEDLKERMLEHQEKHYPKSFSARYNLNKLLYYKNFSQIQEAREHERYIKGKTRKSKIDLINSSCDVWMRNVFCHHFWSNPPDLVTRAGMSPNG